MAETDREAESPKPVVDDLSGAHDHDRPRLRRQRSGCLRVAAGVARRLATYRKAGFPVAGVYDVNPEQSRKTAERFSIPKIYSKLEDCFEVPNAVIDMAVPPQHVFDLLRAVPPSTTSLVQKPRLSSTRPPRLLANHPGRRVN